MSFAIHAMFVGNVIYMAGYGFTLTFIREKPKCT